MGHKLAPQSEVAAEVERLNALASGTGDRLDELKQALKQTMWDKVGVIRDGKDLQDAQKEIAALRDELGAISPTQDSQPFQAVKLANMLTVAEMVCRAALMRTETRGAHYRADYEKEDDRQWLKTIEISCRGGNMTLRVIPVESAYVPHESGSS
jgi:succinate dehydrogenase/fumarate reductase flavoprotein subunit